VKSIPDTYKDLIQREIALAMEDGFPVTSKWIRDILHEEGIDCAKRTLTRTLKRWNIPYGNLKTAVNNKPKNMLKGTFGSLLKSLRPMIDYRDLTRLRKDADVNYVKK